MSRKRRQRGFTLVEILVAAVIGLFLTAGMIQMYAGNKQTYRFTDALSRMQESGRYALELLAAEMRMAGFWGCSRGNDLTVNLTAWCTVNTAAGTTTAAAAGTATNALEGEDGSAGTPDAPDSITLRGAVGAGLIVDTASNATTLNVEGALADVGQVLPDGRFALVADCRGGDLFQVTGRSGGTSGDPTVVHNATGGSAIPGNATNLLSNAYDPTAAVHRWREVQYFIQNGANNRPSLWIREDRCRLGATAASDNAREVVEGVENMQITYGEDADDDGTADRYVPRANVADMGEVVSVRISLLLASADDGLADQAQQITFDGDTYTAADRRIYQVITATYALRNRSL